MLGWAQVFRFKNLGVSQTTFKRARAEMRPDLSLIGGIGQVRPGQMKGKHPDKNLETSEKFMQCRICAATCTHTTHSGKGAHMECQRNDCLRIQTFILKVVLERNGLHWKYCSRKRRNQQKNWIDWKLKWKTFHRCSFFYFSAVLEFM